MIDKPQDTDMHTLQGISDCRKSTSEYVFLFGGTFVSWLSKKHNGVAISKMERKVHSVQHNGK